MSHEMGLQDQLGFLKLATEKSIKEALDTFGESLTAAEARAFEKLSSAEIKSLYEINLKIANARGVANSNSDWECINVAC